MPDEVVLLDSVLPIIRAAAQFAQYGFAHKATEQALQFQRRGEFVFHLDFVGRPLEGDHAAINAHGDPLAVLRGRLVAPFVAEQQNLDGLIHRATGASPQPRAMALTRKRDGARSYLLALPVCGEASDVLAPTAALGVLIDPAKSRRPDSIAVENLRMAADLTAREAQVAGLISAGVSPHEIAAQLSIGEGTVRNHLKGLMQKCGVHSQIELAALITRLG